MPPTPDTTINADQGWSQLAHTFAWKMPKKLRASGRARHGLMQLTRGKRRG